MKHVTIGLMLLVFSSTAFAAKGEYIFSAPPRETPSKGMALYGPIAKMLSKKTGKRFVYKHPGEKDWLNYTQKMTNGKYDLLFDGPHFVGWRMLALGHRPLVRLPHDHTWVIVVSKKLQAKKNLQQNNVKLLGGHTFCTHAPPNFGTLTLLSLMDNPMRQPYLVTINGWKEAFNGVIDGKCTATILPKAKYLNLKAKLDPNEDKVKKIHEHAPFVNQAFSVGKEVPKKLQDQIKAALLSREGQRATALLRARFGKAKKLVAITKPDRYILPAQTLRGSTGFSFATTKFAKAKKPGGRKKRLSKLASSK